MLHEDRARAESFGAIAPLYDRARPTYPAPLVDSLVADGARSVLDVGCGTGIAGALFAARGCKVLGVEVDPRMAALARTKGLEVEVTAFEEWDHRGRRFDLVISAQAWHWVEPRSGAIRAACALCDGGRIGLFWNHGDPPAHVRDLLAPIYHRLAPDIENYSILLGQGDERTAETTRYLGGSGAFGEVEIRRFPWTQAYATAEWLDHLRTHSDHCALPPARLKELLEAIGGAIDSVGGSFEMPYEALLVTARVLRHPR